MGEEGLCSDEGGVWSDEGVCGVMKEVCAVMREVPRDLSLEDTTHPQETFPQVYIGEENNGYCKCSAQSPIQLHARVHIRIVSTETILHTQQGEKTRRLANPSSTRK